LSYCARSSLPVEVLGWLAARLAHLTPPRPPGRGGTPPLTLEVRLDAVAAVLLDGLSYQRAGRMVGISKTEVGDSMDLLLGPLAALGFCQPDGRFVTTLQGLRELLEEMAASGEVVVIDGLATRVQRPAGWANQKVLYDAKRRGATVSARPHARHPGGSLASPPSGRVPLTQPVAQRRHPIRACRQSCPVAQLRLVRSPSQTTAMTRSNAASSLPPSRARQPASSAFTSA
jgi:hypothetical protein